MCDAPRAAAAALDAVGPLLLVVQGALAAIVELFGLESLLWYSSSQ